MQVHYDFGSCRIIPPPCPDSTVGNCPFHLSISARLFSMRRSSSSWGVSEFCRMRFASDSPWARVTSDLASPSASAIFFAASACVVCSSLRARSAYWMACALAVMAVAITAGTRGAPIKPNCCTPTPTGAIFCSIMVCTLRRNSAFFSP